MRITVSPSELRARKMLRDQVTDALGRFSGRALVFMLERSIENYKRPGSDWNPVRHGIVTRCNSLLGFPYGGRALNYRIQAMNAEAERSEFVRQQYVDPEIPTEIGPSLRQTVVDYVYSGRIVDAIKALWNGTGCSLLGAKKYVDLVKQDLSARYLPGYDQIFGEPWSLGLVQRACLLGELQNSRKKNKRRK
jgi:hypothetical protein